MAEILIKIGTVGLWRYGDPVSVFNNRHIRQVHTEHLCDWTKFGFNGDGLRPADTLAEHFQRQTYQYLFRRVSRTEIERIEMATGVVEVFGPSMIDVELFLKRRLRHNQHRIFGTRGKEFWFGGQVDFSMSRLDQVWDVIEGRTLNRRAEPRFQRWPAGREETKRFLLADLDTDITDDDVATLTSPVVDRDGNVTAKRRYNIDVDAVFDAVSLPQATRNAVRNPQVDIDLRGSITLNRTRDVVLKTEERIRG